MIKDSSISWRDFDWTMLGIALAISLIGVVQIYSTTMSTDFAGVHRRQITWIVLGLILMFLLTRLDYHTLLGHSPLYYLVTLIFLVALLAFGSEIAGTRRWIRFGSVNFQVSELVKLVIILLLARFFTQTDQRMVSWPEFTKVAITVGLPFLLIAGQPDLGSALTLVPITVAMLFLAGLPLRYFGMLFLVGLLALPVGVHFLKPYQRARITTFLDPGSDPQKSGYQVLQSRIAIGSGQLWGKGTTQGTQTQLRFLPVPHTDFIFAAYAEEHGFAGVLLALILYLGLLTRLLGVAQMTPDAAGTQIIGGIVAVLAFQILVNVGMVIGYMPVAGIPLPFMSYGGSSLVFSWLAVGLANSVRVRRFVN